MRDVEGHFRLLFIHCLMPSETDTVTGDTWFYTCHFVLNDGDLSLNGIWKDGNDVILHCDVKETM